MTDEESPDKDKIGTKSRFSRLFDSAMIETRMIDALIQADGWTLAQFTNAPPWLRQIYSRHAIAACQEMHNIEKAESNIKPSEQSS